MDNVIWSIPFRMCSGRTLTHATGGGWVRGQESNGSSSMLGQRLEKVGLKRKQDGSEPFPGATHRSISNTARPSAGRKTSVALANRSFDG